MGAGINMLIMGKPGAGKGTVAAYIKERYGFEHLSTGDIFRKEIAKGSELGLFVKGLIDKGKFVPDDKTIEIVKTALSEMKSGYILDGFPRNIGQAHAFEKMLISNQMDLDLVLHLDIDDDVIYQRLADRQICPKCQATYHRINKKPKKENLCDLCKVGLVVREDDKPDYMRDRLATYQEKTEPIVEFYFEKGLLETVQSDCSIEKMLERVSQIMDDRMATNSE